MRQGTGSYLQNFKSIYTCKTKRDRTEHAQAVAHLVIEIQAMIYDAARVRRLCTKLEVNMSKYKNFHFGGNFCGGVGGRGIGLPVDIKS